MVSERIQLGRYWTDGALEGKGVMHIPGVREERAGCGQLGPSLSNDFGPRRNGDCGGENVCAGIDEQNLADTRVQCCLEGCGVIGRAVTCAAQVFGMHECGRRLILVLWPRTLEVITFGVQERVLSSILSNLLAL